MTGTNYFTPTRNVSQTTGVTGIKCQGTRCEKTKSVEQNRMNRERVESVANVCRPDVACPRLDGAVLVVQEGLAPHTRLLFLLDCPDVRTPPALSMATFE